MDCPAIMNLKLDAKSLAGVARIREIDKLAKLLQGSIVGGSLTNIFAGASAEEALFNVYSHDWKAMVDAVGAVPKIKREQIEKEAYSQWMSHQGDARQRLFWKAIYQGCKVPMS